MERQNFFYNDEPMLSFYQLSIIIDCDERLFIHNQYLTKEEYKSSRLINQASLLKEHDYVTFSGNFIRKNGKILLTTIADIGESSYEKERVCSPNFAFNFSKINLVNSK